MKRQKVWLLVPVEGGHQAKVFAAQDGLDSYLDQHGYSRSTDGWLYDQDGGTWRWYAVEVM